MRASNPEQRDLAAIDRYLERALRDDPGRHAGYRALARRLTALAVPEHHDRPAARRAGWREQR